MKLPSELPEYSWPTLSPVLRQYVVVDDQGRYGIAYCDPIYQRDTLFARPIGLPAEVPTGSVPGTEMLPRGATLITDTVWHVQPDGAYEGIWCDYSGPSFPAKIPPDMLRRITVVDDLGYVMPDRWADIALAGSDQAGHWDYGATLGKVGGEPPVMGQMPNEITIEQAEEYAREVGEPVTARGLRLAAGRGDIPGARKVGRDWLITYGGLNHYLDNRPKRGPVRKATG